MQKRHVLSALCAALACSALTLLSGCERQAAEVKQPSKEGAKVEAAQPPKESAKTEVNPHPIANVRLDKEGFLQSHGVWLIGTNAEAIDRAEDRQLFKDTMAAIGEPTIPSDIARDVYCSLHRRYPEPGLCGVE